VPATVSRTTLIILSRDPRLYRKWLKHIACAGSRPARNLQKILRAGRGRHDLVDQILAFGGANVVHQPVSMKGLVAETSSLRDASLPSRIELTIRECRRGRHIPVLLYSCSNVDS